MAGVPKKMRALFLTKYISRDYHSVSGDDLQQNFEVREVDVPVPKNGQVLVRVARSPINPSDLSTLKGSYDSAARSKLPWIPGFEGSGTVVANGGGMMGWTLVGKRVGVVVGPRGGMWAEYVVAPATTCLALPDEVDFDTGSSCFVNPMTVLGFIECAKSGGHTSIVHTAAASALGKMLIRCCVAENIKVIAIVRKKEQIEELKKLGAAAVFSTNPEDNEEEEAEKADEGKGKEKAVEGEGEEKAEEKKSAGWEEKFKTKCKELRCRLAFDAVGGDLTGKMMHLMPNGTVVKVYGGLSEQPVGQVSIGDLIFQGKKLEGFWVSEVIQNKGLVGKARWAMKVRKLIGGDMKTQIREVLDLNHIGEALEKYVKNMSAGKVLLDPSGGKKKTEEEGGSEETKKEEKKETTS